MAVGLVNDGLPTERMVRWGVRRGSGRRAEPRREDHNRMAGIPTFMKTPPFLESREKLGIRGKQRNILKDRLIRTSDFHTRVFNDHGCPDRLRTHKKILVEGESVVGVNGPSPKERDL